MKSGLTPEQAHRIRDFLYNVEAGHAASLVPNDLRTLLAEVEKLQQERNEARAMLAHVAMLLKRQVDRTDLDEWTKVHLAVAMTNAECGARGRTP